MVWLRYIMFSSTTQHGRWREAPSGSLPRRHRSKEANLYAYEIAAGTVMKVGRLETAIYAGSDVRDSRDNIYMGRFGDADHWEGKAALAIIHAP